jgi:PAS domain S-box-containing protein
VIGLTVVASVVASADDLPRIILGLDASRRTWIAGPWMLPLVALATAVAVVVAWRHDGIERWAALAATTALADVVLTLFSTYRFSVGWYAGRTLTIVSAGVVLTALLIESSGVKSRLAADGERLRITLARTDALERLQHTLLTTMADGVIMQRPGGGVVASNPAAQQLLGLTAAQLDRSASVQDGWLLIDANGRPWSTHPSEATFSTAEATRDQVLGVQAADGRVRWLSVNTVAARDDLGVVDYTISSMTDITRRHTEQLAARQAQEQARDRIVDVLRHGLVTMVFQPIVHLATGDVLGTEALARFTSEPVRSPDKWFAEAETVGLGTELELAAIRAALDALDELPPHVYLSLNASPSTVMSEQLSALLAGVAADRLVLELTEHVSVDDYSLLERALCPLRSRGLRLAVDDAGAGFASMRHILNLHPDLIKLDVALTHGLHNDPARRALISALLSFSDEINAQIIAEGIETEPELTILQQLGIQHGQGFLLGRPGALPLPTTAAAFSTGTPTVTASH